MVPGLGMRSPLPGCWALQPQLSSPKQGHGGRVRSWWLSRTSSPKATSTALLLGALLGCVGSVWVLLGPVPGKAKPRGGGSWGCTGRRRWACPRRIGSRMVAWAPAAADPTVPRRAFARQGGAREMPSQCHRDPGTSPRRCSLARPFLHLSSFHSPRKTLPFSILLSRPRAGMKEHPQRRLCCAGCLLPHAPSSLRCSLSWLPSAEPQNTLVT